MHQALLISELQVLIFSKCSNYSLATLARTCRSFHDNALDRLWHHVDFLRLLRVSPTDLFLRNFRSENGQWSSLKFQRTSLILIDQLEHGEP
jgi:F-box-like